MAQCDEGMWPWETDIDRVWANPRQPGSGLLDPLLSDMDPELAEDGQSRGFLCSVLQVDETAPSVYHPRVSFHIPLVMAISAEVWEDGSRDLGKAVVVARGV